MIAPLDLHSPVTRTLDKNGLKLDMHNWLEMQKVVTFPLFLMEHPVFIMYIQVMYMRKGKKEKKFFLDMLGSEPAAPPSLIF